jgi:hypothetical protein
MHGQDRALDIADSQRPKSAQMDDLHPIVLNAAAASRWDTVGGYCVPDLQRMMDNAGVAAALQDEEQSPVHKVIGSGEGRPLEPEVRADMKARLGHDFSHVRVHDDGRAHESATAVNARAYTVGSDIVFQRGCYNPATPEGKLTLAHELIHVVQQSQGPVNGTEVLGGIRISEPGDRFEREAAANAEKAVSTPDPAAPSTTSSVADIQRDPLGLQRTSGNWAVARLLTVQRDVSKPKELVTASKLLGDVQGWAEDQQRSQKVIDTSAVVGLDLSQKENVVAAIKALSAALPALRKASSPFGPGLAALRLALDKAKATEAALKGAKDELDRHQAKDVLKEGQVAMAKALAALQGVKGVNAQIKKNLKTLRDNMADTVGIHDTINEISRTIRYVQALDTDLVVKPEDVERVLFLLRSFVAVNDPASANVPKPAEVAAMKNRMGSMQAAFARIFGNDAPLGLFIDYAGRQLPDGSWTGLVGQIDVRDSMAKAGAPIKQVPGEADARAYFTKLKKQPNPDVFAAYTAFMSAFFYHKEVPTIGDLTATNPALMSEPVSITGTRPLVCTGYATLGAELLRLADATPRKFIVAIRASDAQLLSGNVLDDAHAIAKFTRGGQDRYVSNHLIVDTEEAGIGPDAVAWTNKNYPLIRAEGPTMADAVTAVMQAMAHARAAAKARAAKKGKAPAKKGAKP